ncbi:MAG: hypothetical protein V4598_17640 [Bdellovibrionota bacterium]
MHQLSKKEQEIVIKLNVEDMSPTQVRLLKNITSLLANVVCADEESEYFDTSSELFKKVAELVKHSQFAESNRKMNYGDQAVEYSVENLNETLDSRNLHNIDN